MPSPLVFPLTIFQSVRDVIARGSVSFTLARTIASPQALLEDLTRRFGGVLRLFDLLDDFFLGLGHRAVTQRAVHLLLSLAHRQQHPDSYSGERSRARERQGVLLVQ